MHVPDRHNSGTIKLFQWAQVPAITANADRNVTVEVITANQCFRRINFNYAFVLDYNERYSNSAGVGEFTLIIRQKADKVHEIKVDGGIVVEEN